MKKDKVKAKGQTKTMGANAGRGQVVKLKSAKGKSSLVAKFSQWWRTVVNFVAESWQELKKVSWPGRKETIGTTMVVVFLVVIISGYLGLVDIGLSSLLKRFMHR